MNQSEVLATLADSLVERGYCILDDAIPTDLLIHLVEQSRALDADDLELAGIGRDDLQQTNPQVRKNQIALLTLSPVCSATINVPENFPEGNLLSNVV